MYLRYIVVDHVPMMLGLQNELRLLCEQFGELESFRPLDELPTDPEMEAYLAQYVGHANARYVVVPRGIRRHSSMAVLTPVAMVLDAAASARYAKRKLDESAFYGSVLQVRYAPEYETVEETRQKLIDRRRTITRLLKRTRLDAMAGVNL